MMGLFMNCYLCCTETLINGFGGFDSGPVNTPVEEEHDEHGDEETAQRRIDNVAWIVGQFAGPVVAVLLRWMSVDFTIVPTDQRRETNKETQKPNDGQENFGPEWCHDGGIGDWTSDGQVAVEADCAQIEDGCRAHPNIDG